MEKNTSEHSNNLEIRKCSSTVATGIHVATVKGRGGGRREHGHHLGHGGRQKGGGGMCAAVVITMEIATQLTASARLHGGRHLEFHGELGIAWEHKGGFDLI